MTIGIDIRRVQRGDEALWRSAVATILLEPDQLEGIATTAEITAALADPNCFLYLALSDGRPVGLVSAYAFPDVAERGRLAYLYDIEVLESHQRTGIGAALIDSLSGACRANGVKLIWAGTHAENRAARRTFERTGAELVGDAYAEYEWNL